MAEGERNRETVLIHTLKMGRSGGAGEGRSESPFAVRFMSREMVSPATPTPRHTYYLSCFDIFWKANHYNQRLLFYQGTTALSGQGADGGQGAGAVLVERLKSSLAFCLVHYYPWSGRLSRPAGHRLSIDCNDAGVEFVEASLPHLPISFLSSQGFQSKPFFEHLCPKVDHSGESLFSSPLLSVQATHFSDGGLALGITQSHVVADGQALWNFMVSWGECARGLPLSAPPVLDRERLALPNPSLEKARWGISFEVKETDMEEEDEEVLLQKNGSEDVGSSSSGEGESAGTLDSTFNEAHIPCTFLLPASAVKDLKAEDGGVHSTYEVTCAHLWQRLTVARQRPSYEPTFFCVVANCRTRLKPPLPATYFGNAVTFGMVVSTSGKICKESVHAIASRIHDVVVETVRDDTLTSLMHWLETHDHDFLNEIASKAPKRMMGVIVASSTRFPVYEVDFGWGKPMAVRSAKVPGDGELVFFGGHPNLAQGDVEICARLPEDVLRRFLEDPLFRGLPLSTPFEYV